MFVFYAASVTFLVLRSLLCLGMHQGISACVSTAFQSIELQCCKPDTISVYSVFFKGQSGFSLQLAYVLIVLCLP